MVESMLQEDAVFPGQFPSLGTKRYRSGEHRLMLAMLCDAAYVYGTDEGKKRGLRMRHEVEQWFESTDTSYVFSFESVCDALGLDPSYIRHRIMLPTRQRDRRLETTTPTAAAA